MPYLPILAVLLLLTPAADAQQQKPIHVEVIESFESDTNLRAWTLRDVKGTLSTDHATEGQRSARLHYPQWKEGMGLWPASIVDHGRGGFRVRDWSRFEKLLFDVYSATDQQTTLKLRLDDATGKRWTRAFAVPSKEPFTVEVPISSLSIDTTQVVHFDLYICCGPRNPYANWFVEYTALEPRLLWWMTYQHEAPGFLYYLNFARRG